MFRNFSLASSVLLVGIEANLQLLALALALRSGSLVRAHAGIGKLVDLFANISLLGRSRDLIDGVAVNTNLFRLIHDFSLTPLDPNCHRNAPEEARLHLMQNFPTVEKDKCASKGLDGDDIVFVEERRILFEGSLGERSGGVKGKDPTVSGLLCVCLCVVS